MDPFAFFHPTADLDQKGAQQLSTGEVLVRVLPAESGEMAILIAVRTTADGSRLVKWVRDVADLKKSAYVPAISRFSSPPQLIDVRTLEIDHDDLDAIRACRPASCDLKLTAAEMTALSIAARSAGATWRPVLQDEMRRLVVDRVTRYLAGGSSQLGPYADQDPPPSPQDAFSAVMRHSAFLGTHAPGLADYLENYPRAPNDGIESLAYWSIERLGGRPSLTATHVAIVVSDAPDRPEALVAGRQIFSTHYVLASLNITAILRGRSPAEHYLVYLNRSRVDVLDRWYGGVARLVIERRLRGEAAEVFQGLKSRLEQGDPPR